MAVRRRTRTGRCRGSSSPSTQQDWDAADPELLQTMFGQLVLIRVFEEYVLELAAAGLIHGPAHSSIGQEGGAVGSVLALTSADQVNGSHRGHHQFLAKVLHHVAPKGIDLVAPIGDDVRDVLLRTLAEICGLDRGWSHGRGGSMHLQWKDAGAMGTNAIVGGGVPMAAGFAWADRQAGTDAVSVTYFGDGAVNIGSTLETFNLAAAWQLPICFFIENNRYAVSTSVFEATGEARLSGRGPGFGIPSWKVDGMDPLAVHLAMQEAVAHMRAGGGPTVVEADTYRYFHQNGAFPGSAFGYRTKEEEQEWRAARPDRPGRRPPRPARPADRRTASTPRSPRPRRRWPSVGDVLLEPLPGGKPGPAPDPRGRMARPGVRRRRRPRRPGRVRRRPDRRPRHLRRRAGRAEVHRRGRRGDEPAHGDRPARRRHGRGRAPPQRRHQRRHPRSQGPLPRPHPRHADQRERLRRPRRRHRHRRPVPPRRRVHVRRLHVGRGRPAVQPDRQGPAHVRRRRRGAVRAAQQGRHGHRLRLAALDGPGRRLRHPPGWRIVAPSTPFDYVGPYEQRPALPGPGRRPRARRPLQLQRARARSTTSTTACRSARRRPATGGGGHRPHLPRDDQLRARRRWRSSAASTPRSSTCAGSTAPRSTGTRSARASGRPTTC